VPGASPASGYSCRRIGGPAPGCVAGAGRDYAPPRPTTLRSLAATRAASRMSRTASGCSSSSRSASVPDRLTPTFVGRPCDQPLRSRSRVRWPRRHLLRRRGAAPRGPRDQAAVAEVAASARASSRAAVAGGSGGSP
jgi:hypothetical protein